MGQVAIPDPLEIWCKACALCTYLTFPLRAFAEKTGQDNGFNMFELECPA